MKFIIGGISSRRADVVPLGAIRGFRGLYSGSSDRVHSKARPLAGRSYRPDLALDERPDRMDHGMVPSNLSGRAPTHVHRGGRRKQGDGKTLASRHERKALGRKGLEIPARHAVGRTPSLRADRASLSHARPSPARLPRNSTRTIGGAARSAETDCRSCCTDGRRVSPPPNHLGTGRAASRCRCLRKNRSMIWTTVLP